MKKIVIFIIFCILITSLFANLDKVIYQTRVSKLNALSIKYYNEWKQKHDEALVKAKLRNIPVIINIEDVYMELSHFEFEVPIYHITHNSNAAITVSTDHVHPGGVAGLNLTGSGILVREWDGGGVRMTHQELTGRLTNGDGTTPTHYHSTHVAGTIMASGVQANSKGMAYQANLKFFDWDYDTSEMATEATLGMLLSNHSYGFGRGWVYTPSWVWYGQTSPGEDWSFGFYNNNSEDFDAIAYDAPYYLIVESAGNDRGDGPGNDPDHPNDGPYDCVADMAVSKNVLCVAAVEDMVSTYSVPSDVVMSSFSSWGPCDDGRIKPDISANGVGLYSTDDDYDTDYTTLSGTSMAAPSVTGSLALIQEHSDETNGLYLRSSTLKALTLHCADEAGSNDGPDYAFGWGLMNTERMANYISNEGIGVRIEELTLSNGGTYEVILPSNGVDPFKATLCWTDPEGTPVTLSLDPANPMLINDLDIRITKSASTYYPWKLDRLNPANAATNSGDNSLDNVEQVYIASPTAENYTITVTHKGTLVDDGGSTSSQQFGLIISGIDPSVLISTPTFSPPAGTYGTTQSVTISCATSEATIYYTTDGTDPDDTDLVYSSPISISSSQTLKAIAYLILWAPSSISEGLYILNVSNGSGNNGVGGTGPAVVDMPITNIDGNSVDPDISIDPEGDLGISVNITVTDEVQGSTPVLYPDNVIISYDVDVIGTITGVNLAFDLEFTGLSDLDQVHWFNGTNWVVPNNVSWSTPNHVTFDLTLTDRDASTEIILSNDNPLPVTLSSFTAAYIGGTPIISWITQSESDNIGWNIYRAYSSNFGQAYMLNLQTIPGNGTTTQPSFYSFTDKYEVYEGFTYWYWLESISGDGETESFGPVSLTIPSEGNDIPEIPLVTELHQNFPNPFNPSTLISFDIKEYETGVLSIYNIKGQLIVEEEFEAGRHDYTWDARDHSSGVYLYKLQTKYYSKIMKMLLVK